MKTPKTIKGYLSLIEKIEAIHIPSLKGYDDLNKEQRFDISKLSGQITNIINK